MTEVGAPRWVLDAVEIKGFLGVGDNPLEARFDRLITVLVGPNGSGKSTILEAVEWALFGITAVGAAADELATPNLDAHRLYIHRGSAEASVRLLFSADGHTLEWSRTRQRAQPRATEDVVACRIDGEDVAPDHVDVFGVTGDLYRRAIAPGQGALQALTSGDRNTRDSALDRLFGIEMLNSLTVGLGKARRELEVDRKALRSRLQSLQDGVHAEIERRFNARIAARSDAFDAGATPDALTRAAAIASAAALASELGVTIDTQGGDLAALQTAFGTLRETADSEWSRGGLSDRESRLLAIAETAKAHRERWQMVASELLDAQAALEKLVLETGTEQELEAQRSSLAQRQSDLDNQLTTMNARVAVLSSARQWVREQQVAEQDELACPVCERLVVEAELAELIDATLDALQGDDGAAAMVQGQLSDVRAQVKHLASDLEAISEKRRVVESLSSREQALCRDIIDRLRGHQRQLPDHPDALEAPVCALVGEALSEGTERTADGTSAAKPCFNDQLGRLAASTDVALQKVQDEIAEIRTAAQAARDQVLSLERVIRFLKAEAELDALDAVVRDDELSTASVALDAVDSGLETLLSVTLIAERVSQAEAESRIEAIGPRLGEWFGKLSNHASLTGARIDVATRRTAGGSRNSYSICATSEEGWEASGGPTLSGGYQTVLAVAALCALNDDEASCAKIGLLALDEPTQSLDPRMTTKMGQSLAGVGAPRLLVTTTEEAFVDAVRESAGASQVRIMRLDDWSATTGTRQTGDS